MKNFKKVISAVIALAMFASSIATVGASKYTDVADTASYAEAVEVLTALGIVTGYEENGTYTFKPEGTITRAEAATMIVGALNMTEDAKASAGTSRFADVNTQAAWAAGYINVGVAQGFINGMDATTFAPQENVTYAQMCVMLTSIAGYGEYAAANSTGVWSSGYTSMAASTGINKGVAVADDTALTRGQVAQMIYNTLVTPMLGVAEYSLTGNTYSQLDGKNNREFKTLLSDKFDGYVATVTITGTPLSSGLDNDEVEFDVTKADWWPETEEAVTTSSPESTKSLFEGVDVNGNHLQNGKAVFVTNDDDELVMVYFSANGKTTTKELAAADYKMQSKLGESKQYTTANNKIVFGSTSYKMADEIDIYVNGSLFVEDLEPVDDVAGANASQETLDKILGGAQGTIKLVKADDSDKYTTIYVDFYQVSKVTSVEYKNNETVISMTTKSAYAIDTTTEYDEIVISDEAVEEGKTAVTVKRNGAAAELSSIVKGDIIAYAVDFNETDLEDPKVIDIIATNDVVTGKLASKNADDETFSIDGKDYSAVDYATIAGNSDMAIKNTVELTLDPFGRIYAAEISTGSTKYAIALKVTSAGALQMIIGDGSLKTYEMTSTCATNADAAAVAAGAADFEDYLDGESDIENRVIAYTVKGSSSELSTIKLVSADAVTINGEYKSRTEKLDGATISSTTQVIDATDATTSSLQKKSGNYSAYATSNFKNNTTYTGFAFKTGSYTDFVVLTGIGTKFGEEARFAVVQKTANPITNEAGDDVDEVIVLVDGKAEQSLEFVDGVADSLGQGDVFFYETDSDGYVDKIYVIYDCSAGTFKTMAQAGVAAADLPSGNDGWSYDLADQGTAIQLVEGYVTEVTEKSIAFARKVQVATGALNTNLDIKSTSDIDGIASFGIDPDCVAYEYDKDNENIYKVADRFKAKEASSLKASNFEKFEIEGSKGEFSGDLESEANYAVAMIVDDSVVAIYTIIK